MPSIYNNSKKCVVLMWVGDRSLVTFGYLYTVCVLDMNMIKTFTIMTSLIDVKSSSWCFFSLFLYQETSISPEGVATLISPQTLIHHMQGHSIHCIASGGQAPNFKFFFYAQKAEEPSTYLVECVVNSSSCKVQLKVKADDQSTSQAFSELFQSALSKFGFS